jgi:hypothetical protein
MKEPYGEGLASHTGSESCAWNSCKAAAREALTGAQAGGVFSREMLFHQRADAVHDGGRQQRWMRNREYPLDSARSETPRMQENSTRENREAQPAPDRRMPHAGKLRVRIFAGGTGQPASLPQLSG